MEKKHLLQDNGKTQEVKEIAILTNPQDLKMILGSLSWKILNILSKKEMYPLEIARQLGMHEQKVYYHIRKLAKAGAIVVQREENKKGATAKYYKTVSPAFGIEFQGGYQPIQNICTLSIDESLQKFFHEFIVNGVFDGKIVVGSPQPHGPFKTSARDGHYAAHLALFMGQFAKMPTEFAVKLDVDVKAATILSLTNVIGSTLTRISRVYIGTQAGPEIGVAATKTFTSQLSVLAQLALRLAKKRGKVSQEEIDTLEVQLDKLPEIVDTIVKTQEEKVKQIAHKYSNRKVFFFLGRGISTATAFEGRLKLMEIAYIPSIAFPAGESKHGPISLIEEGFPVVFVCQKDDTHKTVIGNIMEMKARGAKIIAVIEEGDNEVKDLADDYLEVPKGIPGVLSPIPFAIPLQLLAYYTALELNYNPDMPRNLAKSVTVK